MIDSETIIGSSFGFLIGTIAGSIYTGRLVARESQFDALKSEVMRTIQSIDFVDSNSKLEIMPKKNTGDLVPISSELHRLGHHIAADTVNMLCNDINDAISRAPSGQLSVDEMNKHYSEWQKICREMKPTMSRIATLILKFNL